MAEHGGYRKPSKPAAVSGPGAHSQRTDGRPQQMDLPNAKYGEAANFQEVQGGAPLAPTPSSGGGGAPQATMPTPMGAPSGMPDVPVTAGAAAGEGAGPEALGLPNETFTEDLKRRFRPLLPFLIRKADDPYASPEQRDQVRFLIANL
jgi:hypothetical protein